MKLKAYGATNGSMPGDFDFWYLNEMSDEWIICRYEYATTEQKFIVVGPGRDDYFGPFKTLKQAEKELRKH